MTHTEIAHEDKLIAEIMGVRYQEHNYRGHFIAIYPVTDGIPKPAIRAVYHSSWDALIPVYNKCLSIWVDNNGFANMDGQTDRLLAKTALMGALSPGLDNQLDIRRACMMIVDFIKWYNKIKVAPGADGK